MNNTRLQTIYRQAGRLFNLKGYPDTKMAEIAKASGIAVGTMYSTFTGKEAVFSFIIHATLDKDYFDNKISLPLKPVDEYILLTKFSEIADRVSNSILKITGEDGAPCKDFSTLMGELFDLFADYLLAFDNLERNRDVLKELSNAYLVQKKEFFAQMKEILSYYASIGQIRQLEYVSVHIPFLIDTLTWWAMNSWLNIPQVDIPRDTAKEICLGIIERAYCLT